MLEEILKIYGLVHLIKSYRQLAIDESRYPSPKGDPYCHFNKKMQELDHEACRIGVPGIIPEKGAYNRIE